MTPDQACAILGVSADAPWLVVRRAYREQVRLHHPDRPDVDGSGPILAVIEAFHVLEEFRERPQPSPPPVVFEQREPLGVVRLDSDTLAVDVPADETYRLLLDAAHDVGEITYLDRTGPIIEVLCRFVDEPATSLMLTLQGRATYTEVICTVESIEARPAPPAEAVIDLLEAAVRRRCEPGPAQ